MSIEELNSKVAAWQKQQPGARRQRYNDKRVELVWDTIMCGVETATICGDRCFSVDIAGLLMDEIDDVLDTLRAIDGMHVTYLFSANKIYLSVIPLPPSNKDECDRAQP